MMDVCKREKKIMSAEKRNDSLPKTSSILSVVAILLTIALFVRMETVFHEKKKMDLKFVLEIQQIHNALKEKTAAHEARVEENSNAVRDMDSNGKISRRSLKTNGQYPDALQGLGDGIENYVVSITKESVESSCLPPGEVGVTGPPGPKGSKGPRGELGPTGNTGNKGEKGHYGVWGPPGDSGFLLAPKVSYIHPTVLSVNLNQHAVFHCLAGGNPKPSVSWSKINGTGPIKTNYSDTLRIKNAGYDDAGSYVCTVTSYLGQAKEVVKLSVEVFLKNSTIIKKNELYQSHLSEFLTPAVGSKPCWVLCYRASTHGWAASTFHSRCDGKADTVTIIKSGQYVFGGYIDKPWASNNGSRYSTKAFIFSLRNKEGFEPFKSTVIAPQWASSRKPDYGPIFGGGGDICIADNANSNTNSYTDFGISYFVPRGVQDRKTILAGSYKFTPDEVEVFYLG